MEDADLEARLENLGTEIAKLRQKVRGAKGAEKVGEMERRQQALGERLTLIKGRTGSSPQNAKSDFSELANELTDALKELVNWTDSDYELNHGRKNPPE